MSRMKRCIEIAEEIDAAISDGLEPPASLMLEAEDLGIDLIYLMEVLDALKGSDADEVSESAEEETYSY